MRTSRFFSGDPSRIERTLYAELGFALKHITLLVASDNSEETTYDLAKKDIMLLIERSNSLRINDTDTPEKISDIQNEIADITKDLGIINEVICAYFFRKITDIQTALSEGMFLSIASQEVINVWIDELDGLMNHQKSVIKHFVLLINDIRMWIETHRDIVEPELENTNQKLLVSLALFNNPNEKCSLICLNAIIEDLIELLPYDVDDEVLSLQV